MKKFTLANEVLDLLDASNASRTDKIEAMNTVMHMLYNTELHGNGVTGHRITALGPPSQARVPRRRSQRRKA